MNLDFTPKEWALLTGEQKLVAQFLKYIVRDIRQGKRLLEIAQWVWTDDGPMSLDGAATLLCQRTPIMRSYFLRLLRRANNVKV